MTLQALFNPQQQLLKRAQPAKLKGGSIFSLCFHPPGEYSG